MMTGCSKLSKRTRRAKLKVDYLITCVVNFSKNINELEQEDFLLPEEENDEFMEDPSINQFGTDNGGGYTNMLDKWMNNL